MTAERLNKLRKRILIQRSDERSAGNRVYEALDAGNGAVEQPLLCDPLTKLVNYEDFELYVTSHLADWCQEGIHLAIGDVDDLRGYVTSRNVSDQDMFGHLAGNFCMKTIGKIVCNWELEQTELWSDLICATFGGDEVIVAAVGNDTDLFRSQIEVLARCIRDEAPRPCTFACHSTGPIGPNVGTSRHVYYSLVSAVDKALFDHKEQLRSTGTIINGTVFNVQTVLDHGAINRSKVGTNP